MIFEPLIVDDWTNPEIENLVKFEIDGTNPGAWAYDVHRIYIKFTGGSACYAVVKSDLLDQYWDKVIEITEEDPFCKVNELPVREKRKFRKVLKESITSKLGAINKDFETKRWRITMFSPDVGISRDPDGTYDWSS